MSNHTQAEALSVMDAEEIETVLSAATRRPKDSVAESNKPMAKLRVENPKVGKIQIDRNRDALLTDFGNKTLVDRYLLPGETYQDMFVRVSRAYADDTAHAQRLYDYMSKLWFMPATPVLSNGGAERGLPISCFLNAVDDSLDSIVHTWTEMFGLPQMAAGSELIGAMFALSVRKLVVRVKHPVLSRSSV